MKLHQQPNSFAPVFLRAYAIKLVYIIERAETAMRLICIWLGISAGSVKFNLFGLQRCQFRGVKIQQQLSDDITQTNKVSIYLLNDVLFKPPATP